MQFEAALTHGTLDVVPDIAVIGLSENQSIGCIRRVLSPQWAQVHPCQFWIRSDSHQGQQCGRNIDQRDRIVDLLSGWDRGAER